MPPMPTYTVQPVTTPALLGGRAVDAEQLVDRLARAGALGPAVSIDSRGRVSATYQVEQRDAVFAAATGRWLALAVGLELAGVTVWAGEADDDEVAATG
jgi:hypothetical protein